MKTASLRRATLAVVLALGAGGLGACEDAPGGPDDQTPAGLVVVDAQGNQVAAFDGISTTGGVRVSAGAQQAFRVYLTGRGGGRISIDGGRYTLRPLVVTTALAGVTLDGADRVVVVGRSAGSTWLVLTILQNGIALLPDAAVPLTVS
ncbi:MAG TPA: hypothetical protein VHG28_15315 [Longimicrobiaceae bacterium]|nr:hypothetical protein [Longimicrobiaceae bacterium]